MGFEALDPFRSHGDQAIVLDNSVAMRWLVASAHAEHQRFALNVREHIKARNYRVLVPYLWIYEAAHVVSRYVVSGELPVQVASRALLAFEQSFTIVLSRESPQALSEFAQAHSLSAYDAAYVMLAQKQGLGLATLDKDMREAAANLGVSVLEEGGLL